MESYLPTEIGASHARTLYLKETEAPAGYDRDKIVHTVVITKSIDVFLDSVTNSFVNKTIYGIEIDGANAANIVNQKRMGPDEREDGKIDIAVVDQDGAPLTGSL